MSLCVCVCVCMYFRADRPAFARPCERVHRSTSLMSSSLLLQQCPACLVRLIWIIFEINGRWLYSCCFLKCCLQDLFNIARSILVQLPSNLFFSRLVSVHHDHRLKETAFHLIVQVYIYIYIYIYEVPSISFQTFCTGI